MLLFPKRIRFVRKPLILCFSCNRKDQIFIIPLAHLVKAIRPKQEACKRRISSIPSKTSRTTSNMSSNTRSAAYQGTFLSLVSSPAVGTVTFTTSSCCVSSATQPTDQQNQKQIKTLNSSRLANKKLTNLRLSPSLSASFSSSL